MKKLIVMFFVFMLFSMIYAQDEFGKEETSYNVGCSVLGPVLTITQGSGEFFLEYHAFDWENNEDLINKPTSGGGWFGWNIFLGDYVSISRTKWLLGIGAGILSERVGTTSAYSDESWTGSITYYEIHVGIRYFLSQKIAFNGWVGYPIYTDRSKSILESYEEEIGISGGNEQTVIPVMLSLTYQF